MFLCDLFTVPSSEEKHDKKREAVTKVPGPYPLPILGTRWIFSCIGYYKLNKVHDAYKGKKFGPGIRVAFVTTRNIESCSEQPIPIRYTYTF